MTVERLWVYRDTPKHSYPLLLVLGREGNNTGPMLDVVGRYDWDLSPLSAQWNKAYGFVARMMGVGSGATLKRLSNEKKGSPVVFSNASPLPLLNSMPNKDAYRRSVSDEELQNHAKLVFSLSDSHLGTRYCGVIFSTGPDKDFSLRSRALQYFAKECSERGIPIYEIPYLGKQGGSTVEYDSAMPQEVRKALGAKLREFL